VLPKLPSLFHSEPILGSHPPDHLLDSLALENLNFLKPIFIQPQFKNQFDNPLPRLDASALDGFALGGLRGLAGGGAQTVWVGLWLAGFDLLLVYPLSLEELDLSLYLVY
jgi:hypothetical protein